MWNRWLLYIQTQKAPLSALSKRKKKAGKCVAVLPGIKQSIALGTGVEHNPGAGAEQDPV